MKRGEGLGLGAFPTYLSRCQKGMSCSHIIWSDTQYGGHACKKGVQDAQCKDGAQ